MNNYPLRLILADIRSTYNVGAILRTADACSIELVYACGYTPFPAIPGDHRPAHIADANTHAIAKTALGAETTVPVRHLPDTAAAIREARASSFSIIVLEQAEGSLNLLEFKPTTPIALVLGNEPLGIDTSTLQAADTILELPMLGRKESLNVAVASGIALYHLRFTA
ncbi:MAG TPA: TrmH family RNA methyltransferase [Candidatus Saccharimonadia bacterium]|jgi:tRNA G18 (ribose-2'-O)-methylase SpoU